MGNFGAVRFSKLGFVGFGLGFTNSSKGAKHGSGKNNKKNYLSVNTVVNPDSKKIRVWHTWKVNGLETKTKC